MPTARNQSDRDLSSFEDAQASERAPIDPTVVPGEFDLRLACFGCTTGELDDGVVGEEGEFVRCEVRRDGGGEEGF